MKYLYKNTGVTVESGFSLDSTLFSPVTDENKTEPKEKNAPVKKTARKATVKK